MSIRDLVRALPVWWVLMLGAATTVRSAELQIPAFTAYTLPSSESPRVSERNGVSGWTDPAHTVHWYGRIAAPGALQARLRLRLPAGTESKLRLTVAGGFREVVVRGGANCRYPHSPPTRCRAPNPRGFPSATA